MLQILRKFKKENFDFLLSLLQKFDSILNFHLDVHDENNPLVHAQQCLLSIGTLKLTFHGRAR